MHNSNECKRNFVAIYDGGSSVEHLKNKFCSTVANDVMLVSSVAVVRLWADEGSRKSRFKILFTTFHSRESSRSLVQHDTFLSRRGWELLLTSRNIFTLDKCLLKSLNFISETINSLKKILT